MFEFITTPEDRGQVGIGTLIVFIAMVLVAAIAAGVLINTAGFLQTQAEATGQDSTDLVSERIDVSSAVGIVSDVNTEELDQVRLTTSGAPGADDIDLSDTTVQAVGPGGQQNLVFASGAIADNEVSVPGEDEIDAPDEVDEVSDEVEVGVGSLSADVDHTLTVEDEDGGSEEITIDPSNDEDDQVVTVDVSGLDFSDGETLSYTLEDDTSEVTSDTSDVVSTADSDVSVPGDDDEIDTPAEVDEDASGVDVGVSALSDGDDHTLIVEDDEGNTDEAPVVPGTDDDAIVTVDFGNIDPAATDSLDIRLEDVDDNEVDSGTSSVVDSVETVDDLRADEFGVQDDGTYQENAVLGNEDQFTVVLNPSTGALENTDNPNNAFGQSDSATLDLVSPAGATTQVELRAPDLFNENGEAVKL